MKKLRLPYLLLLLLLILSAAPITADAAMKLGDTQLSLQAGNAYVLRLSGNTQRLDVAWKSSKKKVVSITSFAHNRAVLKAKKAGTAKITARVDGKKLTCRVTVAKTQKFPASLTLTVGDSFTFNARKKAAWTLKKKRGTLSALSGDKKALFTASKTGKCTVKAVTKKKQYTCKIKIIRSDGASKADLKEDQETVTLTENQKTVLSSLAFTAVRFSLGTDDVHECEVYAMDLTDADLAFMLYQYQYMTDDPRITSQGEYNIASMQSVKDILSELFGGAAGSSTFTLFRTNYVDKVAGDLWYMNGTGDFGSAGKSYFEGPDRISRNNQMITLEGRVMVYNTYAGSYIHTWQYKAAYWENTNGKLQFDHVEIISPEKGG